MQKTPDSERKAHRVISFLNRDELDFLDKISKDALFSTGTKISRSKIIAAIVNVLRKLDIDACGATSKKELEIRIMKAILNKIKRDN